VNRSIRQNECRNEPQFGAARTTSPRAAAWVSVSLVRHLCHMGVPDTHLPVHATEAEVGRCAGGKRGPTTVAET
ncbi:unnamed protein product, partial [Amoebophrya sp. A120]